MKKTIGVRYKEIREGMHSNEIIAEIAGNHHFVWSENTGIIGETSYVKAIGASKVVNGYCLVYVNCDDNIHTLRVKESDLVLKS